MDDSSSGAAYRKDEDEDFSFIDYEKLLIDAGRIKTLKDHESLKQKINKHAKNLYNETVALKIEYIKKHAEFKAAKSNLLLLKAMDSHFDSSIEEKTLSIESSSNTGLKRKRSSIISEESTSFMNNDLEILEENNFKKVASESDINKDTSSFKKAELNNDINKEFSSFKKAELNSEDSKNTTSAKTFKTRIKALESVHNINKHVDLSLNDISEIDSSLFHQEKELTHIKKESDNCDLIAPSALQISEIEKFNKTMSFLFNGLNGVRQNSIYDFQRFICKSFAKSGYIANVVLVKDNIYSITLNNQYVKNCKLIESIIVIEPWKNMEYEKSLFYISETKNTVVEAAVYFCERYEFIFDTILLLPILKSKKKLFKESIIDSFDGELKMNEDEFLAFMRLYKKRCKIIKLNILRGDLDEIVKTFFSIKCRKNSVYKIFISYLFEHHIFKKVLKKSKVNFDKVDCIIFNKIALQAVAGIYLKAIGNEDYIKYEVYDGFLQSVEEIIKEGLSINETVEKGKEMYKDVNNPNHINSDEDNDEAIVIESDKDIIKKYLLLVQLFKQPQNFSDISTVEVIYERISKIISFYGFKGHHLMLKAKKQIQVNINTIEIGHFHFDKQKNSFTEISITGYSANPFIEENEFAFIIKDYDMSAALTFHCFKYDFTFYLPIIFEDLGSLKEIYHLLLERTYGIEIDLKDSEYVSFVNHLKNYCSPMIEKFKTEPSVDNIVAFFGFESGSYMLKKSLFFSKEFFDLVKDVFLKETRTRDLASEDFTRNPYHYLQRLGIEALLTLYAKEKDIMLSQQEFYLFAEHTETIKDCILRSLSVQTHIK
ncbi:hypothetical protein QEN19_003990 [Hanseniaspora menglaensis]